MKYPAAVVLAALLSAFSADALTLEELLDRTLIFGPAKNITMGVTVTLSGRTGSKARGLEVFISRDAERLRVLVSMVSPAFLSQMKFLYHKDPGGAESAWMKTSQGVRRLAQTAVSGRIFDSDFTVDDFTAITESRYTLAMLPGVTLDSSPCFAVEARPKTRMDYERKVIYIEAANDLLRGIDFLDVEGAHVREYRVVSTREINGMAYPVSSTMEDLTAGSKTTLLVTRIDVDTALPDGLFNKGNL